MSFSTIMRYVSYAAGAAATIIVTGGLAAPAWVIAALGVTATVGGNLAASHLDSVNVDAADKALAKADVTPVTKS